MQGFEPAKRLRDVSRAVELQPLASGDSRYVDMSEGRNTIDLGMMRASLEDFDAQQSRFAKFIFTGHRGCGKSTELLRLENDLAGRFTALHFFATEDEIIADYDYNQLLTNGSVLAYNGNESWYDVHPVIQDSRAFREAQTSLSAEAE